MDAPPTVSLKDYIDKQLCAVRTDYDARFTGIREAVRQADQERKSHDAITNEWRQSLENLSGTMLPRASYEREHAELGKRLEAAQKLASERIDDVGKMLGDRLSALELTRLGKIEDRLVTVEAERKGSTSAIVMMTSIAAIVLSVVGIAMDHVLK